MIYLYNVFRFEEAFLNLLSVGERNIVQQTFEIEIVNNYMYLMKEAKR